MKEAFDKHIANLSLKLDVCDSDKIPNSNQSDVRHLSLADIGISFIKPIFFLSSRKFTLDDPLSPPNGMLA